MIHYTCDRCHREIDSDSEVRYSIEVQVNAVFDAIDPPGHDDDSDHLMELHEVLERLEDCDEIPAPVSNSLQQHFDLCSDCYKVYARNPLSRDVPVSIQFSQN